MSDAPIPLFEGELSGAKIVHQSADCEGGAATQTLRCKRGSPRRSGDGIYICFTVEHSSGKVEHVECPVINMSAVGFAIEFDEKLERGTAGYVAYTTISHDPVSVSCSVQRCESLPNGQFLLGLKLNRKLEVEERRPARPRPGRELVPGLRPRKLRERPQFAKSKP